MQVHNSFLSEVLRHEQDGISAMHPGFDHLIRIDDEVFSKYGFLYDFLEP